MDLAYQDLKWIDVTQVSFGVREAGISRDNSARITNRSSFLDTSVLQGNTMWGCEVGGGRCIEFLQPKLP